MCVVCCWGCCGRNVWCFDLFFVNEKKCCCDWMDVVVFFFMLIGIGRKCIGFCLVCRYYIRFRVMLMLLWVVLEYGYIWWVLFIRFCVMVWLMFGSEMFSLVLMLKLFGIWLMLILLVMLVFVGRVILVWLVMNFSVFRK